MSSRLSFEYGARRIIAWCCTFVGKRARTLLVDTTHRHGRRASTPLPRLTGCYQSLARRHLPSLTPKEARRLVPTSLTSARAGVSVPSSHMRHPQRPCALVHFPLTSSHPLERDRSLTRTVVREGLTVRTHCMQRWCLWCARTIRREGGLTVSTRPWMRCLRCVCTV